jgi:hypothetical protein
MSISVRRAICVALAFTSLGTLAAASPRVAPTRLSRSLTVRVTAPKKWPGTVTLTAAGGNTNTCAISHRTCTIRAAAGTSVVVTVDTTRTQAEPSLPEACVTYVGCFPATSTETLHATWTGPCAGATASCTITVGNLARVDVALSRIVTLKELHSNPGGNEYCGEPIDTCVDTHWGATFSGATPGSLALSAKVGRFIDTIPSTTPSVVTASQGTVSSPVDVTPRSIGDFEAMDFNETITGVTLTAGHQLSLSVDGFQYCHTGQIQLFEPAGTGRLTLNFDATAPNDCNLG